MKRILSLLVLGSGLLAISSCNNAPPADTTSEKKDSTVAFDLSAVKMAITENNKAFGAAFQKGDSATFAALYSSDACLMAPNMPKICGPAAIASHFKGGVAMGIHDIKLTTDEVLGSKDAVVETGNYEVLDAKGKSLDKGKYIVIWKEENGKWKLYRDTYNSDLPPMAAPPAKKMK